MLRSRRRRRIRSVEPDSRTSRSIAAVARAGSEYDRTIGAASAAVAEFGRALAFILADTGGTSPDA